MSDAINENEVDGDFTVVENINFIPKSDSNIKKSPLADLYDVSSDDIYDKRIKQSGSGSIIFLSENPHGICDRLPLLLREKEKEINRNRFGDGNAARIDELLEYKSINPTQRNNCQFYSNAHVQLIT